MVIEVNVTGSGNHFNVFIVTNYNHERQTNNQSFGYIQDCSVLNVTSADIKGTLKAGDYYILVENLEQGDLSINDIHVTPLGGAPFPWEMILVVLFTATITAIATFFVSRKVHVRKGSPK
jgi:hypothetical protein